MTPTPNRSPVDAAVRRLAMGSSSSVSAMRSAEAAYADAYAVYRSSWNATPGLEVLL